MLNLEDITCAPDGGPLKRKIMGYGVPLILFLYAAISFVDRDITIPLKHAMRIHLTGFAAQTLSLACVSFAAFMHFHWGWGLSEKLWTKSQKYKMFSLAALLVFLIATVIIANSSVFSDP